jgi:flagellar biosynthesis chaperone FliJ
MWEFIGSLIGLAGGIFLMVLKDTFFKGKQVAQIKSMEAKLILMDTSVTMAIQKIVAIESQLETHSERLGSITRDHGHLEDYMEKLNETLQENSVAVSSLKATLTGLQEFIQNLIAGNLKFKK